MIKKQNQVIPDNSEFHVNVCYNLQTVHNELMLCVPLYAQRQLLAVSASSTHGLIAQLVRASERNSVVVGSNPTQTNFL